MKYSILIVFLLITLSSLSQVEIDRGLLSIGGAKIGFPYRIDTVKCEIWYIDTEKYPKESMNAPIQKMQSYKVDYYGYHYYTYDRYMTMLATVYLMPDKTVKPQKYLVRNVINKNQQ